MTTFPALRMVRSLPPLLLLWIGAAACADSDPLSPRDGEPIQTDRQLYVLQADELGLTTRIVWSYTNPTDGPVYVVNCLGASNLYLDKLEGEAWVRAWTPVLPECLSPPIVVQPAATRTDTLELFAGYPSNDAWPKFETDDVEGVYRLVWEVLSTYDESAPGFGNLLPLEDRISNTFELCLAAGTS